MKKILTILTTASMVMALVSCDKNDHECPICETIEQEVKKMPSKVTQHRPIPIDIEYFYDVHRRLVKIVQGGSSWVDITYNSDNAPIKLEMMWDTDIIYQDHGKKITILRDTFWLNDEGQFIKWYRNMSSSTIEFTYNSDGNIIKWYYPSTGQEINFSYSDALPIFRYVNVPEWFLFWLHTANALVYPFEKKGYLPSGTDNQISYELDVDNYAIRIKNSDALTHEYEYILIQ